jgi:hypothetical protein
VTAVDGTVVDLADTAEMRDRYATPSGGRLLTSTRASQLTNPAARQAQTPALPRPSTIPSTCPVLTLTMVDIHGSHGAQAPVWVRSGSGRTAPTGTGAPLLRTVRRPAPTAGSVTTPRSRSPRPLPSKGREERITPLTTTTEAVIQAWIDELNPTRDNALFPTNRGGPARALSARVKAVGRYAGAILLGDGRVARSWTWTRSRRSLSGEAIDTDQEAEAAVAWPAADLVERRDRASRTRHRPNPALTE